MLTTLLVPLDGSPMAERALGYAACIARRSGATIVVAQAVAGPAPAGSADELTAPVEAAEAYLQAVARRIAIDGLHVETRVCADEPVGAILSIAEACHADLVVMATRGRGGPNRIFFGSVADQVVRRATVPVLLVPSIVEHGWPTGVPRSILVPLDGSALAESALEQAGALVDACGTALTLLRVVPRSVYRHAPDGHAAAPADEDGEIAEALRYVEEQAARQRARHRTVECRVRVGEPARTIGDIAHEQQAGLIVMATHGTGGLSRLIVGSVASAVQRHTTVPLLLVRPADRRAREQASASPDVMEDAMRVYPVQMTSMSADAGPIVSVQLTASDLELIERSLRALGYAPGYDYSQVQAARALAERLRKNVQLSASEPVAAC